jgi:hypothetical protein
MSPTIRDVIRNPGTSQDIRSTLRLAVLGGSLDLDQDATLAMTMLAAGIDVPTALPEVGPIAPSDAALFACPVSEPGVAIPLECFVE